MTAAAEVGRGTDEPEFVGALAGVERLAIALDERARALFRGRLTELHRRVGREKADLVALRIGVDRPVNTGVALELRGQLRRFWGRVFAATAHGPACRKKAHSNES